MMILLDQGMPRSAAAILRAEGHDAVHTGEIGASTYTDEALLCLGREQGRTIITLDSDFHALLALEGGSAPSVVRVRIEGLRGEAMATLLTAVLAQCRDDLQAGALITVQERRVRIRRLPLIR